MNEYTYDYYIVDIPDDIDTDKRLQMAIDLARQQARLYALPCEWVAEVLDDGQIRVRRKRPRPTTKKHYHVVQGMCGGYLPDLNWPVRTKREAEQAAAELARQWRDEWDEDDNGRWKPTYRIEGSAKSGRYDITHREPSETELGWYIEIVPCQMQDCWKEIEE